MFSNVTSFPWEDLQIAMLLRRTPKAIQCRRNKLGIPPRRPLISVFCPLACPDSSFPVFQPFSLSSCPLHPSTPSSHKISGKMDSLRKLFSFALEPARAEMVVPGRPPLPLRPASSHMSPSSKAARAGAPGQPPPRNPTTHRSPHARRAFA
jgi:hypothetical protein